MTRPALRDSASGSTESRPTGARSSPAARSGLVTLSFDERLELTLHRFESVVDHFAQRLVHLVRALLLFRDQLVAGRHSDIDSDAKWIAGMLRVVGVFDHDVAAADVIAEAIEPRGFITNELLELVGFVDAPIRNLHR